MMLALDELFGASTRNRQVEGHWRTVRLCLDRASDEVLNIGVVFVERHSGASFYRLAKNLTGIRCLYGENMVDDAAFLIHQAEAALEAGTGFPDRWNVTFGPDRFIRGESPEVIVDAMYQRVVSLSLHERSQERLDTDEHSRATRHVRRTVRDLLKRHMNAKSTPEFWRDEPMAIQRDDHEIRIDLQVVGTGLLRPHHGAIVSSWYKTQFHRQAHLNNGVTAVVTAAELFPEVGNVLYLLRPTDDDGFTAKELRAVAQDVDSAVWLANKRGATVEQCRSEQEMAQKILADLDALPLVR